jgi:hypothetical protein
MTTPDPAAVPSASTRADPAALAGRAEPVANPRGEALVAELRWVHDMIRRDLATLRRLADAVRAGLPPFEAAATIEGMTTMGPLWQLRMNCLRYCRFVESHHHGETGMLFPVLLRADPALAPVVERLNADHVVVAAHLDAVSATADTLVRDDTPEHRAALATALDTLSRDLLDHLAFEEDHLNPTLRTLTRWPHLA